MREKLPASGARWIDEEVRSAIPRRTAPVLHRASALGAHGSTASAAAAQRARTRPPTVGEIPGESERQTLAASSLESPGATCEAPEGARCTCREAQLGSTLPGPIAER